MSKNKQENYLDDLLNSVSRDKTPEEMDMLSLKSELEKMRSGDEDALSSSAEDRFLRDFEDELENDNYKGFIEDFEKELGGSSDSGMYVNTMDDDSVSRQAAPAKSGNSGNYNDASAPIQPERNNDMGAFGEIVGELNNEIDGGILDFSVPEEPSLAMTADGEVDLSGNSGADLMDILSGDNGLSDLSDMLSGDGEFHDPDSNDEFTDFAEKEMQQQEQAVEESGKKKKGRKKKKEKKEKEGGKGGFLSKISKIFFGEEEEFHEADIIVGLDNGSSAAELSDENQRILEELDSNGEPSGKKKEKKKKPKKEKPKKEKKPKEPKPKKEKPKKEKPKKEKKPKPVDNTPPLPKGPVILIFVMVISLMALVLLGTNLTSYQTEVTQAKEYYRTGDYVSAYKLLQGRTANERDEQFFNQLAALAAVASEMDNYETFLANGKQEMAMDSIVCAAGRYDINYNFAREWECTEELDKLRSDIEKILSEKYQMSFDDALELYRMDRGEYSQALLARLDKLGLLSE